MSAARRPTRAEALRRLQRRRERALEASRAADAALVAAVDEAGWTCAELGRELGMTKQGAHDALARARRRV